jgi:hypothetical protein
MVSWGKALALPIDLAVSFLLFVLGFVFATMTITVTSDRVEWCLNMGLFRQTILRPSIKNVSVINISLWNGLGIRTNNFRDYLWSIGGSSAIRLELDNGRKLALSFSVFAPSECDRRRHVKSSDSSACHPNGNFPRRMGASSGLPSIIAPLIKTVAKLPATFTRTTRMAVEAS